MNLSLKSRTDRSTISSVTSQSLLSSTAPLDTIIEQTSDEAIDIMTTKDLVSVIDRYLERYYSIMSRQMLETTPQMRGVRLHSTFDRRIIAD
jgi:hypothetical protein